MITNLCFEALIELSEMPGVWPGSTQDERLRAAHVEFTALCRQHKVRVLYAIRFRVDMFLFLSFLSKEIEGRFSQCDLAHGVSLLNLRKQLQADSRTFPSLAQKHFNGSVRATTKFLLKCGH